MVDVFDFPEAPPSRGADRCRSDVCRTRERAHWGVDGWRREYGRFGSIRIGAFAAIRIAIAMVVCRHDERAPALVAACPSCAAAAAASRIAWGSLASAATIAR